MKITQRGTYEDDAEDVLRFWYPELSEADHERMVRQFKWWFGGGADEAVVQRFIPLLERATRGELDHWSAARHPPCNPVALTSGPHLASSSRMNCADFCGLESSTGSKPITSRSF